MKDIDNLCSNCFKDLTQGAICAECGYDNDTHNDTMYLAEKTVLKGKYVIGSVLNHESDAATYSGYDLILDKPITIREFLPKGIANRLEGNSEIHVRQKFVQSYAKYRSSFFKLWTTIEKLQKLSAIIPVYDVFESNGTVYAIIEYLESIPLREYLIRNPKGYILWEDARLMFMPVLTTIEALHSNGIIHGSITPDNLVLCRDGKVRLSEFTIAEANDIKSDLEFNVHDGYTALEQYENSHKLCPATDIYSFSACIYRALVGTNPPPAPAREVNDKLMIPNSIAEKIPMHVIKAMGHGLQIYPEKRVQTISEFRDLLDASPVVQAKSAVVDNNDKAQKADVQPHKLAQEDKKKNNSSKIAIVVLIVLIIVAVIAGWYVVSNSNNNQGVEQTSETTPSETYPVPNFVNIGLTQSDVESQTVWQNQFAITFEYEYSTDVEEGYIFKQSIEAGETVNQGTAIVLTVSKGIKTETVPDVGGLSFEAASQKLEALGFKVSSVEIYNDGSHTEGYVKSSYGMAPAANTEVAVGEEIVLQVYGSVQETTTQETTTQETTTVAPTVVEESAN